MTGGLFVVTGLCFGVIPGLCHDPETSAAVAEFRELRPPESFHYLAKLAKAGRRRTLLAIAHSDAEWANVAAREVTRLTPPDEVVEYIAGYRPGTGLWMSAFEGVRYHPKEAVIDYVVRVVKTGTPETKACCYFVCMARGWSDLADQARSDQAGDHRSICLPNRDGQRVSDLANDYLKLMARQR